ncbi:MAG: diguanylate cyclase [Planctomycetota bacterium]
MAPLTHSMPPQLIPPARPTDPADSPARLLIISPDAKLRHHLVDHLTQHPTRWRAEAIPALKHLGPTPEDHLADTDLVLAHTPHPSHTDEPTPPSTDTPALRLLDDLLLLAPDLPVILLTDHANHREAADAIARGAYDYLTVASTLDPEILPILIEKNRALQRVKQENAYLQQQLTMLLGRTKSRNADLEQIAATDPLTALANRRAFLESLHRRFADAKRHQRDLACLLLDLDGFKPINDQLGHAAGDRLLIATADALRHCARASDTPGRLGGDEFVLLLPETDADEAARIAHRLRAAFQQAAQAELDAILKNPSPSAPYTLAPIVPPPPTKDIPLQRDGMPPPTPTLAIGLATRINSDTPDADALLDAADAAMYHAKRSGKGHTALAQPGDNTPTLVPAPPDTHRHSA